MSRISTVKRTLVTAALLVALPLAAFAQAFKKSAVSYKDAYGTVANPAISVSSGKIRVTLGQQGGDLRNKAFGIRFEGPAGEFSFGNTGVYDLPPGRYQVSVEGYLSTVGVPARIEAKVDYD